MFGTVFILIILPVIVVLTNKATFAIRSVSSKEPMVAEDVETAVINAKIEETLSLNMAKKFE
jgi:predicted Holliday junction resolvase-like endonuclease